MKKTEILNKIRHICDAHPEIKLAYFFGSQVSGNTGSLSDFDFAFYADEKDRIKLFDLKLDLMSEISQELATDNIDVVILNLAESPELKYSIIKDGELILAQEPFKVIVEPKILREYFDFHKILTQHHLTRN